MSVVRKIDRRRSFSAKAPWRKPRRPGVDAQKTHRPSKADGQGFGLWVPRYSLSGTSVDGW